MSIDQLRRECNAVVRASNQRWLSVPNVLKKDKVKVKNLPANAVAVKVYDSNESLVAEFQSMKQAAMFSETNEHLVRKSVMRNIFIKTKYGELRFQK